MCNRGLSGYNTRWAARAVGSVLPDGACAGGVGGTVERPDLLTLFFGANDAVLPGLKVGGSSLWIREVQAERVYARKGDASHQCSCRAYPSGGGGGGLDDQLVC